MNSSPETVDTLLAQVSDSGALLAMAPMIHMLLDQLEQATRRRVLSEIKRDGAVAPERATSAWIEISSYQKLHDRIKQELTKGNSAGKALAPYMKQ